MDWLLELAPALGVEPVADAHVEGLLDMSRDVAHSVERRATPLAMFLLGMAVERRRSAGVAFETALDEALTGMRATLPA